MPSGVMLHQNLLTIMLFHFVADCVALYECCELDVHVHLAPGMVDQPLSVSQ